MGKKSKPRYPIYIPSKGRADLCRTADFLIEDEIPFHIVVEPQEQSIYEERYGAKRVLVLPFRDLGSVVPARNWIKQHATESGAERHWQLDDNIKNVYRMWKGKRIPCEAGVAFAAAEDFVDRYENVAIAGLNYSMWIGLQPHREPPFLLNCRVYSCSLILNSIPHEWRGTYNEDADICLQVLSDGWCTILINAFLVAKLRTMSVKGGNTDEIYHGEGRLKMARSLERVWPGVVSTRRRWDRPQHVIKHAWRRFDTQLIFKKGIDLDKIEPNDYGLKLNKKKKIASKDLRKLYRDYPMQDD